jgi:hypothetical protein
MSVDAKSTKAKEIVMNGTYFYPAWKHYGGKPVPVTCDCCKRENLECCIGYSRDLDLCMTCVDTISKTMVVKEPVDWKKMYATDILKMWQENKPNSGIKMVCTKCYGGMPWECKCAVERFVNDLTYEQFQAYMVANGKSIDEKKAEWRVTYNHVLMDMWRHHKEFGFGVCAMCNTCGGRSSSFCECDYLFINLLMYYINE